MGYLNLNEEKKLWKRGYEFVVGLDEAGRGPLAGPVVAAAVSITPTISTILTTKKHSNIPKKVGMFFKSNVGAKHSDILQNIRISSLAKGGIGQIEQTNKTHFIGLFSGIRDSKKLSEKQREFFYEKLTEHPQIKWGIGAVSEKVIDKINILEATRLAMRKSIANLQKSCHKSIYHNLCNCRSCGISRNTYNISIKPPQKHFHKEFFLIDGNFKLNNLKAPQKSIIKGDEKVFSIIAAGIIAKVTRDRIMREAHKKYPQYGFDKHKGYGTSAHFTNLRNFGPCAMHRKTFYPVNALTS